MKITTYIVICFSVAFSACSSSKKINVENGFVPLFNGKDLSNWDLKLRNGDADLAAKVYSVDNGVIHVFKNFPDSFGMKENKNATHGLFYTKKKFSRYILKFEYKWGEKIFNNFHQFQYDAGCYYHVINDKIWPDGIEYQIRYNHVTGKNHTGDFWASNTLFQWYADTMKSQFLPLEKGGMAIAKRGGEHRGSDVPHHALDDEWNTCEVIVMGNKYAIHKLNGQLVNYATDLSVGEGIIGFQSETAEIFYRNIAIKELTEDILAEVFLKPLLAQKTPILQKPKVWIYTDMTDKSIPGNNHMGTVNDPDDISAMAGYLLMANEFDTKGIIVASTHRSEHKTSANQAEWATNYFIPAYKEFIAKAGKKLNGFPASISFQQSSIKETAERYQPANQYNNLANYSTVNALYELLKTAKDEINVLCWGSLTEPAILINYCISTGQQSLLRKARFIAHWTNSPLHQGTPENPEHVANCREDAAACAYMKDMAAKRIITYYELGAIGQHGIVSGAPKGDEYYNQFKTSSLGKIFAEGKYVQNCVDHSDAATYWTLLGNWGVSLADVKPDGTNNAEIEEKNEEKYKAWSKRIHDELLRRSKLASE